MQLPPNSKNQRTKLKEVDEPSHSFVINSIQNQQNCKIQSSAARLWSRLQDIQSARICAGT